MSEDVILVDVADRVAVVTLNRPESRNALNPALTAALPETIAACDARDDVDAIVLTGADPAFCAGVDLKALDHRLRGAPHRAQRGRADPTVPRDAPSR